MIRYWSKNFNTCNIYTPLVLWKLCRRQFVIKGTKANKGTSKIYIVLLIISLRIVPLLQGENFITLISSDRRNLMSDLHICPQSTLVYVDVRFLTMAQVGYKPGAIFFAKPMPQKNLSLSPSNWYQLDEE